MEALTLRELPKFLVETLARSFGQAPFPIVGPVGDHQGWLPGVEILVSVLEGGLILVERVRIMTFQRIRPCCIIGPIHHFEFT